MCSLQAAIANTAVLLSLHYKKGTLYQLTIPGCAFVSGLLSCSVHSTTLCQYSICQYGFLIGHCEVIETKNLCQSFASVENVLQEEVLWVISSF
jgi:hypothetical protein